MMQQHHQQQLQYGLPLQQHHHHLQQHQTYSDIQANGLPVRNPLDFPKPTIHRSYLLPNQLILDQHPYLNSHNQQQQQLRKQPKRFASSVNTSNSKIEEDVTLLCRHPSSTHAPTTASATSATTAYWMKREVSTTSCGTIQFARVVRKRHLLCDTFPTSASQRREEQQKEPAWMTTDEVVAIKVSSMIHVQSRTSKQKRGHTHNNGDPLIEAASLQLIGSYHTNILGCIEVLQDDEHIYTVLPYCHGGTLESYIQHRSQQPQQQQAVPVTASSSSGSSSTIANTNSRTINMTPRNRNDGNDVMGNSCTILPLVSDSASCPSTLLQYPTVTKETTSSDRSVRTVSSDGTFATIDDASSATTMFTLYEEDYDENNQYSVSATSISSPSVVSTYSNHENHVRVLFIQLLQALQHLQKKGVCHRNINSSNVLIESDNCRTTMTNTKKSIDHQGTSINLVLTDFTFAIRIPYRDDSNIGGIADVSQGCKRLLIQNTYNYYHRPKRATASNNITNITSKSLSPRIRRYHSSTSPSSPSNRLHHSIPRKPSSSSIHTSHYQSSTTMQQQPQYLPYIAPEILEGQPYDGYTVDLWSVGVLLYFMLLGHVPFHIPSVELDVKYRQINHGQLQQQIRASSSGCTGTCNGNNMLSNEVMDLLQNMMWHDPCKRYTIQDVLMHPWITQYYSNDYQNFQQHQRVMASHQHQQYQLS